MTDDVHPLIARARALAPELAALTPRHEARRELDPAAIALLQEHGMLATLLPTEVGGHALAPSSYVEVLAALASGDAATAWCTMTASTSTLLAAYLDADAAAAIWSDGPTPIMAGVFAPSGTATLAGDGSARLTGRWSYGSGSRHAAWFALGAMVAGERRHVTCIVAARDVEIVDNWDTLGLGGTGSHDVVVTGVHVPAPRIATVFGRTPWPAAPLYRVPLFGVLALGIAGCALGVAETALREAGVRLVPTGKEATASSALAEFARQRAALAGARAYLIAAARGAEAAAAQGAVSDAVRGELRLAAATVAATCAGITRAAFHLGGGASIRAGSPLGRALRDAETILTHRMVADRVLPAAARAILGIGTAPPDL